jgi:hypothetical protein
MVNSVPGRALVGIRLGVGAGAWAAPNLSGRLFGINPDNNAQGSYLARLFGVRDVALAAGAATASGDARRLWWRLGVVCDAADLAAAVIAGRTGTLPKPAAFMVGATAAVAAVAGAVALAQDDV